MDIEQAKNLGQVLDRYKEKYYLEVVVLVVITYILYPLVILHIFNSRADFFSLILLLAYKHLPFQDQYHYQFYPGFCSHFHMHFF